MARGSIRVSRISCARAMGAARSSSSSTMHPSRKPSPSKRFSATRTTWRTASMPSSTTSVMVHSWRRWRSTARRSVTTKRSAICVWRRSSPTRPQRVVFGPRTSASRSMPCSPSTRWSCSRETTVRGPRGAAHTVSAAGCATAAARRARRGSGTRPGAAHSVTPWTLCVTALRRCSKRTAVACCTIPGRRATSTSMSSRSPGTRRSPTTSCAATCATLPTRKPAPAR